ncbi:RBP11-like subunits of RNA polymerase [Epithele typhae]|uniref:RBP11-like subunits of RNA polymerase n=1 Tax=Epithele typhae TaxID=378194 RepID=UPI002007FECE|nr:RBP11-like subunits of RNA polymerase [Epithele typhae]KAH9917651.1 RBP11-like subunits of RNA polymerase [Epithele typhae]
MSEATPKIQILKGPNGLVDLTAATFQIHDESHTIGNALRWMLMKKYVEAFPHCLLQQVPTTLSLTASPIVCSPKVEFCGYSVPHPSENHINVRIQMYDKLSALDALLKALEDLDGLCVAVDEAYHKSLRNDKYEHWDEKS